MKLPPLTARRFIPNADFTPVSHRSPSFLKRLGKQPFYEPALAQLSALNSQSTTLRHLRSTKSTEFCERWQMISATNYSTSPLKQVQVPAALKDLLEDLARNPEEHKLKAIARTKGPCKMYVVPTLVNRLLKLQNHDASLLILQELAKGPKTSWEFATIHLVVNSWLRCESCSLESLKEILSALPDNFCLSLSKDVISNLGAHEQQQLPQIFQLLLDHRARLDLPGFAPFLRAVYSSTDAGLDLIIRTSRSERFPVNFYGFLISKLIEREDYETTDYILNRWLAPLAAKDPQKYLDFVLSMVAKRMLAFDAADEVITDLFEQMGPKARNNTLRRLFQEFRRNARPDRCRQILLHLDKMDVAFVGELLSFVEQFYSVRVLLDVAQDIFPRFKPVLIKLGITEWASKQPRSAGIAGDLPRLPSAPDIVAIPEIWLHIIYRAVLHQSDDLSLIEAFWTGYVSYAQDSKAKVQTEVLSLFVKRLVILRHKAAIELAERIMEDALTRLRFTRPSSGRHGLEGIEQLVRYYCEQKHDPERAIVLVSRLFDHNIGIPMRGRIVRPILDNVGDNNTRDVIEDWSRGLGMRPF